MQEGSREARVMLYYHLNAEITVIMKLDLGNDCKQRAKFVSE